MNTNVVITGLGACTKSSKNSSDLWNFVTLVPDPTEQIKAPVGTVPIDAFKCAVSHAENVVQEAVVDAGLDGVDPIRIGCTFSASKPFIQPEDVISPEAINRYISEKFNAQGERRNVVAACATGAYAVALGASWIEQGLCDVVIAGSVEPRAHPLIEAGFRRMGVVSDETVARPFDKQRTGFVLGEGAGAVVLEARAHAVGRGARIRAHLTGWGWGSDTHSAVAFNSNGEKIAGVIRQALRRAGLAPEAIGHVNAHGTATHLNDWLETQALMKAFGPHAGRLMISGTKSSTGHLLGAAGSVELVLSVQALEQQFVPPTTNLENPDPECPLDYTARAGHAGSFEHALSLSFGFGGPIGALIVSRS